MYVHVKYVNSGQYCRAKKSKQVRDFFKFCSLLTIFTNFTSQARPCPARSCPARPRPVSPHSSDYAQPGHAHPGHAQLGQARPGSSKVFNMTKTMEAEPQYSAIKNKLPHLNLYKGCIPCHFLVYHSRNRLFLKVGYFLDFCSLQLLHLD